MYVNGVFYPPVPSGTNGPAAGSPQLLEASAGAASTTFPWPSTSLSSNGAQPDRYFDGYIGEVLAFSSTLSQRPAGGRVLSDGQVVRHSSEHHPRDHLRRARLRPGGASQQVASLSDNTPGSGGSVINSAMGSTSLLTLSPTGGSTTFSGMIQGGGTLGTISLLMSGSGTQVLSGSMTRPGQPDGQFGRADPQRHQHLHRSARPWTPARWPSLPPPPCPPVRA